ncbi:MAG: penicillin-binding protein [Polyangiaceae bacterium]|nr:penicillin-binding protein [Polyangiaceae bacterium]
MWRRLRAVWLACLLAAGLGDGALAEETKTRGATTASRRPTAPPVDLERMRVTDEGATAPIRTGGEATLTVDPTLQQTAVRLLSQAHPRGGAIIAVDARSGNVLAWASVGLGPGGILGMRAPAASLFKIVTTAALLEMDGVHPNTRVCYSGGSAGIDRRHLEAPRSDMACHPFWQALGHSRNAVYAQLVTKHLMRNELIEMASRFGFGGGVPFDTEAPVGRVTVPFNDLAFARTATGFQNTELTPLGALELAYVVAVGGRLPRVHVVASAGEYTAPSRLELGDRVIEERTAGNLRWMMEVTVSQGTSYEAFTDDDGHSYLYNLRAAGKTGTLQTATGGPTATWFVGFAPSRDPRVVVSVLLKNGSVWRRKANEVARDMMRAYFAARGFRGITAPFAE